MGACLVCYGNAIGTYSQRFFDLYDDGYDEESYPLSVWQVFLWVTPLLGFLSYPKRLSALRFTSYVGVAAVLGGMLLICSKGMTGSQSVPTAISKNAAGNTNWMCLVGMANFVSAAASNQYNGASFYQNLENKDAWGTAVMVSMGT